MCATPRNQRSLRLPCSARPVAIAFARLLWIDAVRGVLQLISLTELTTAGRHFSTGSSVSIREVVRRFHRPCFCRVCYFGSVSGRHAPLLQLERDPAHVVVHLLDGVARQLPQNFFAVALSGILCNNAHNFTLHVFLNFVLAVASFLQSGI